VSISAELEAKILRYYHVEKWRVGTIARQLQVHHGTVQRVLRRAGVPAAQRTARASKADPYLPFILQTLERYPTLTASRLYAMVRERGYRGSPDHFRHIVAMHRPRRAAEAYLRLTSMPGEIYVEYRVMLSIAVEAGRYPAPTAVMGWSASHNS
jgi:transposase